MNIELIINICLLIIFSLTAFVFALAQTSFNRIRIKEIVEAEETDHEFTNLWIKNSAKIQASVTIWFVLAIIGTTAISTILIAALPPMELVYVILISVAALTLLLTWTLLVPSLIAASYYFPVAINLITFMYFWSIIFAPFNAFLLKFAALFAAWFNVKMDSEQLFINQDVDVALESLGDKEESLEAEEHEMIKSIYEFGDTVVREVMTPRTDMIALSNETTLKDVIKKSIDSGHSRIPIFHDSSDNIIGIFYVRDSLKFLGLDLDQEHPSVTEILRAPFFVPETKKVNQLLKEFRSFKIQLAVIVDEYGGTAGIVTMEDLLEEIVGEIHDEYDEEVQEDYFKLDDNNYILDASLAVDDINNRLNIDLPESGDYDTIGGFVMFKLGRLPTKDELVSDKDFDIKVLEVSDRRIDRVQIITHFNPNQHEEN